MRCQFCGYLDSRVIDSRPTEEGSSIRRRRECLRCGRRFTTYEKIETSPLMVVKKDMRREPFNADKIKKGLLHACQKRPVSMKDIDAIVEKVEKQVYSSGGLLSLARALPSSTSLLSSSMKLLTSVNWR